MAYDDKHLGIVFPTRAGKPQGSATERKMLDVVDGASGIRQRTMINADGSTTTLRTRAGQPEFVTTGSPIPPGAPCIRGPFEEITFSKRRWHTALPDLVSSDGLFKIARAPLRKIAVQAGENEPKKAVELHFASSAVGGQLTSPDPLALAIIEPAYGARLWHPKQMGRIVDKGLYFCLSRLRAIVLTCKKLNGKVPFTWWFSKESDPALSGGLPICLNQTAVETGLATRLLHGLSQIKQFSLRIKMRAGNFITVTPGGFLGGLDSPPVSGESEFPAVVNSDGQPLNNLSTAHSCGQPWHGWMTDAGIETHTDPTNFPLGRVVVPEGYVAPDSGDTHYFAIPDLPDVSTAVPDDFAYEGMEYLKDVVFFSYSKRYSPVTAAFELGANRWLHYGVTSGRIHVLRLEVVGSVNRAYANLKVHDDGELTVRGVVGTSREIASFQITSPHTWEVPTATSPYGTPNWYRRDTPDNYWNAFVSSQTFTSESGQHRFPLNSSPTGDRAIVGHYRTTKPYSAMFSYPWTTPDLTSVWEITVQDDLSTATVSVAWKMDVSDVTIGTPGAYWLELYIKELVGTVYLGEGVIEGSPVYYYRDEFAAWYRSYRFAPPSRVPFRALLLASYSKVGALVLTEAVYSYEYDAVELLNPEALEGSHYFDWGTAGDASATIPQDGHAWGMPTTTGLRIDYVDAINIVRQYEQVWTPGFNRLHITDPEFAWVGKAYTAPAGPAMPEIVPYANNVVLLKDLESANAFRSEFVATEAVALASSFGYTGAQGYASYNPRTKEIRWNASKIGNV